MVLGPLDQPGQAGYASYLSNDQKRELLETPDVAARLLISDENLRGSPWANSQQHRDGMLAE